jgi:hypothetical protein
MTFIQKREYHLQAWSRYLLCIKPERCSSINNEGFRFTSERSSIHACKLLHYFKIFLLEQHLNINTSYHLTHTASHQEKVTFQQMLEGRAKAWHLKLANLIKQPRMQHSSHCKLNQMATALGSTT